MGKHSNSSNQQEQKQKKNKKQRHEYYLIMKGNTFTYYERQIAINFGPKKLPKKKIIKPSYPTFNKDRKYYTPTFYIPQKGQIDEQICYDNHQKKRTNALKLIEGEDDDQIFLPKPSKRHDYCGVCRKSYQQYLQHINSEHHKNRLEKSTWHKQLIKMSKEFIHCKDNPQKQKTKKEQQNNELTQLNKVELKQDQD